MEIVKKINRIRILCDEERKKGKTIGFVPTMGYFHQGHLELIKKSKRMTDVTVVSIYVNPRQFDEAADYETYPRHIERDADIAVNAGVDYLFVPSDSEMYPKNYRTFIEVEEYSDILCGESRPGHFRGVCTIVAKLLNIIRPDFAFFGMKDAQQAFIVKKLVRDLDMNVEVLVEPTVREEDGLAMSSRNERLSEEERISARAMYGALLKAKEMIEEGELRTDNIKEEMKEVIESVPHTKTDYIEIVNPDNLERLDKIKKKALVLLAADVGDTRLIDNMMLEKK